MKRCKVAAAICRRNYSTFPSPSFWTYGFLLPHQSAELVASVLSSAPRTTDVSTNGYASEGRRSDQVGRSCPSNRAARHGYASKGRRPDQVGRSCPRNRAARQSSGRSAKGMATRRVDWRRDRHHVLGTSALASRAGKVAAPRRTVPSWQK